MNKKLLKCLIDCSSDDFVDIDVFLKHYHDNQSLRNDLRVLSTAKYISVLYAGDEISAIAINQKAIDYFNGL